MAEKGSSFLTAQKAGAATDAFNNMLAQIRTRDEKGLELTANRAKTRVEQAWLKRAGYGSISLLRMA